MAPNAFQMMCPWDARLLLSSLSSNSLCNSSVFECALQRKGLVDLCRVYVCTDGLSVRHFTKAHLFVEIQLIKTATTHKSLTDVDEKTLFGSVSIIIAACVSLGLFRPLR